MRTYPIPGPDTPEGRHRRVVKLELLLDAASWELDGLQVILLPGERERVDLDEVARMVDRASMLTAVALEDLAELQFA